jgi:hypothetical protein
LQRIPTDPALDRALLRDLDCRPAPPAARLADFLVRGFGGGTLGLIHYGSHSHGAGAEPLSARDFFVILEDYGPAYRTLASTLGGRRRPGLAAFLNRLLPPNVLSVAPPDEPGLQAKCAVISLADLARGCSARARDHFVRARLFQPVRLVWARDEPARAAITGAILEARKSTFEWVRPYLPATFDVLGYGRTMLEVSYAAEIRPESGDHVAKLLEVQQRFLVDMYQPLLDALARAGELESRGAMARDLSPPGRFARFRSRLWFRRSKLRATLRWFKYVALYDDWLDYVIHKLERRSGVTLTLTPLERRWPLIFLWPKALRYLLTRPQRRRG